MVDWRAVVVGPWMRLRASWFRGLCAAAVLCLCVLLGAGHVAAQTEDCVARGSIPNADEIAETPFWKTEYVFD